MAHPSRDPPVDARLEDLAAIERTLEARVRAAEENARTRLAEARAAAQAADGELRDAVETAAGEEDARDRAAHADALRLLEATTAARVAKLQALPDDEIERLAQRAYDAVVGGGKAP